MMETILTNVQASKTGSLQDLKAFEGISKQLFLEHLSDTLQASLEEANAAFRKRSLEKLDFLRPPKTDVESFESLVFKERE